MSKKQSKKKPRGMTFNIGIVEGSTLEMIPNLDQQVIKFRITKDGKPIKPVTINVDTFYERKKNKKILTATSFVNEPHLLDHDAALGRFDFVLAIDTNSDFCDGDKISVCCLVVGAVDKDDSGYCLRAVPHIYLEFWNLVDNPEKVAWREVISIVKRSKSYEESTRYALIVDAFLNEIPGYNLGVPIIDDFQLPKNFRMIYASAGPGTENIANKLLSLADKEAGELMRLICQNKDYLLEHSSFSQADSSFPRIWTQSSSSKELTAIGD